MTTIQPDADELPLGELVAGDPDFDDAADHGRPGDPKHGAHRTIVVIVLAPRSPNPKRFRFRWDQLVGEAATIAAAAFGYEPGTPSFQNSDGVVLDRDLTLKVAGVKHRDKLELVDVGGGV